MAIEANVMQAWLGVDGPSTVPRDLPTKVECVYLGPNPDATKKACSNCVSWASKDEQCYFMSPSQPVYGDMVCGYHIFGKPIDSFAKRLPMLPLTPATAGLISTPNGEGTSCSICKAYDRSTSKCYALANDAKDDFADVEPGGCCGRWTERDGTPEE